jgi:pentose-5-phosphate-3-epimerase
LAADFETLYLPIPGDPTNNAQYRPTTRDQTAKVRAFREIMAETRDTMLLEMGGSERNVIAPAKEARKHIAVYGKVIKKRQDRKVKRRVVYMISTWR